MNPEENDQSKLEGTLTPLDRLVARGGQILSLLFLLSCAVSVYEVIARYAFNAPTIWAHETTIFICALCFAYGSCQCIARNKHIRIVVLYQKADNAAKRVLDIFISFSVSIVCGMLTYGSWSMLYKAFFRPGENGDEFNMETSGSSWDPTIPAFIKLALFLALLLMTIQSVCQLVHHCRRQPND